MALKLRLWNTLSRKLETFRPLKRGRVRLYTCGPTVYNYAHIGNLRTYIFEDVLERTLVWNGYKVKRVMNITDVGHLTGDTDAGEDKIEKEARREKKSVRELARFYTKAFLDDIKKLNIEVPPTLAPATKFIPAQIEIVKLLLKKSYAYETPLAVYFDVTKFKKYGRLSGQKLSQKLRGARAEVVADHEKRHPADFALWFKTVGRFKDHILHWPSPWGTGFPGWHIECSAISSKFLGQPFDLHTGGVDHIGTHHENEIAQSEAAFGKPLAKYWLHGEFLLVDRAKMAKSEKNFFTLADLQKHGANPLAYRYLVLSTHYRSPLNFSWESLEAAQSGWQAMISEIRNLAFEIFYLEKGLLIQKDIYPEEHPPLWEERFTAALNNDLNAPQALSLAWELLAARDVSPEDKLEILKQFDTVLALGLTRAMRPPKISPKIMKLIEERETYRTSKQFTQSDRLREELNDLGYIVEDTPRGPIARPRQWK